MEPFSSFPQFCFYSQVTSTVVDGHHIPLVFGLSAKNHLYATVTGKKDAILLNPAVTSFVIAGSFLIYLTTGHESVYAPLGDIAMFLLGDGTGDIQSLATRFMTLSSTWEKRRVERGSRIVTAVPSAMNIVLQMPRGNLETINPRPLALEIIRSDISK